MEIGIIGTGSVGSALATGLTTAGHEVVLGSREPDSVPGTEFDVATQAAAADHGDVVILALPAGVIVDVAADLRATLAGKTVIDTANEYPEAGSARPLAVRVADAAPDANVVKAFNTIGASRMTDPVIDGEQATMFLAGDDEGALRTAATLAADLGFQPLESGGLSAAGHLEGLARFWIHLSREHGRSIGFRLLRDEYFGP